MATAANAAPSISVDRQFDFRDADFSRVRKMIHERAGISLGAHKREMVYSRLARRLRAGAAGFRQLPGPAGAPARRAGVGRLHQCADHQPDGLLPRIASLPDPGRFRAQPRRPGIDLVLRGLDRRGTVFHRHHIGRSAGSARLVVHGAGHGHRHQCAQPGPRRGLSGRACGEDGGVAAQALFLKGRGANAGQVRVRPEIADMVRYDTLNLLAPSWPINEKFDAIFCRNVMIYFDKPTQARILERFVPAQAGRPAVRGPFGKLHLHQPGFPPARSDGL